MKVLYFQGDHPNFGDDLNEIVWQRLAPELFADDDDGHALLGIGTLIGRKFTGSEQIHVFSSGAGYDSISVPLLSHRFWAVRGPLTARLLGLPSKVSIVDAGIFAPELLGITRAREATKAPIVIPHWESVLEGGWEEACDLAGYMLVNPGNSPAEVIATIASAPMVLTESLHGAIIADVLRVPWAAIVTTGNVPLFKWYDWAASVRTPLSMTPVQSPSRDALRRLGRTGLGRSGQLVAIEEEQAFRHFTRWGLLRPEQRRDRRNAASIVRALAARIDERLGGVSPKRTAAELRRVAENDAPKLSPAGVVEEGRDRLLSRLNDLLQAYKNGQLDR